MADIERSLAGVTHFAAIGTSGQVYPAAGFSEFARMAGARTFELNLEPSGACFDEVIPGPATKTVPEWAKALGNLGG